MGVYHNQPSGTNEACAPVKCDLQSGASTDHVWARSARSVCDRRWECPRYRTCGHVCPLWPDRPVAPQVYHAPPFPFEGSLLAETKCLADMLYGM